MAKFLPVETQQPSVSALRKSLRELESPKAKRDRARATLFSELYPDIRVSLDSGVKKSAIVKVFAEHGMTVSNLQFDELLADAASRGQTMTASEGDMATHEIPVSHRAILRPSAPIEREDA